MNGVLFKDTPTSYRVLIGNRPRVVYARHYYDGTFVRFVCQRTKQEIESLAKSYLPARVGIKDWFEVFRHNFVEA